MLTEQARAYLRKSVEESAESPSDTESFRRALQCAKEAVKVAAFYDESPLAEESLDWAKGLLQRAGADQQTAPPQEEVKSSSKCFVAAACFGEDHEIVAQLRIWREARLRLSILGRCVISVYEVCSPPFAEVIRRQDRARRGIRFVLIGIVRLIGGSGSE